MTSYNFLKEKIDKKKAKISVIGLGYVGLPLVIDFLEKGYFVYGYDTNKNRIAHLLKSEKYITDVDPGIPYKFIKENKFHPTGNPKVLRDSDILIICVPTPLRKVKIPDISYIIKASRTIKKYLRKGHLIILESTTYPGTTREVILPHLRQSGLREEKDFFLSFSPERVDPGNRKYPLGKIPKIVGGLSKKSASLTQYIYSKIIKKVITVSSIEVAETAKLLENTFRMVNIGLINEFALACDRLGVSIWEVIDAAKTKPFGFMPFYPGPGCGGHCLPCDPVYLSWKAKKLGFKTKMIDLASLVNHSMPAYVVERVRGLLAERKKSIGKAKILLLGVTYKKDVKDLRESPALDIIDILKRKKAQVAYFDPLIPYLHIDGINMRRKKISKKSLNQYDCAILVTGHSALDYKFIKDNSKLIFDTRNVYKRNYKNVVKL